MRPLTPIPTSTLMMLEEECVYDNFCNNPTCVHHKITGQVYRGRKVNSQAFIILHITSVYL